MYNQNCNFLIIPLNKIEAVLITLFSYVKHQCLKTVIRWYTSGISSRILSHPHRTYQNSCILKSYSQPRRTHRCEKSALRIHRFQDLWILYFQSAFSWKHLRVSGLVQLKTVLFKVDCNSSLLYWYMMPHLSYAKFQYIHGAISGFCILFHWLVCLLLC